MQAQLMASRRLGDIGLLTGGIAHDFNNLLTVIQGNVQLPQELEQADTDPTQEIVKAVQHGAAMVRQLLAFARRQTLRPQVVDLTDLLGETRRTLARPNSVWGRAGRLRGSLRWPPTPAVIAKAVAWNRPPWLKN
ncbi:histidine kinase dimerization/phospho-acceptor domain-containing protein [Sagittula salina]|uniref:histidine kinase n=1 Tax=Sagittula salina TaxID=2820268 RepID=A0A940MSB8_9RHOB|nr:histidine kinase dimerization/phospho-acceptor domain-containing protein [Sagittula salina]MBP0484132.1 hypothetical protein [Sagittula salina]